jgi:hypothetical protein
MPRAKSKLPDQPIRPPGLLRQTLGKLWPFGTPGAAEEPVVFAVGSCHPMRIALYAAAFQAHWKVKFMTSLGDIVKALPSRRPKAVFCYDPAGGTAWARQCSALTVAGVPFVLLSPQLGDDAFSTLLESGGYPVWGSPWNSENIVKAVEFAEEMTFVVSVQ